MFTVACNVKCVLSIVYRWFVMKSDILGHLNQIIYTQIKGLISTKPILK